MNYIANARHAHNPKVEGSNPSPATNSINNPDDVARLKALALAAKPFAMPTDAVSPGSNGAALVGKVSFQPIAEELGRARIGSTLEPGSRSRGPRRLGSAQE